LSKKTAFSYTSKTYTRNKLSNLANFQLKL
jgi:hypothetical protein